MRLIEKIILVTLGITLYHCSLAHAFKTEHWETANGVKVVFYQAMEVPMLDISLAFTAGSAYDKKLFGLSALTAQMLNEGSAGINASAIADSLADTGAQFDIAPSKDMVVFSLRTLSSQEALEPATTLFAKIINHPDFPEDALEREKKQFIMAIAQSQQSPDDVATQIFFEKLYLDHPYAHPTNGTVSTIKSISKDQVSQFYKQYYVGKNATLVLVGAIDSSTAHQLANKLTQELPAGEATALVGKESYLPKAKQVKTAFPSSQTVIRLGQLGIDHQDPYYFPLMVGNYILGGGNLVSRLAVDVREKRGLTYSISSALVPMPGPGPFLISLSTRGDQAQEAVDVTQNVLKQFVAQGPTPQELEAAKSYLTGSFPMSLSSNKNIANILLRMSFYHLPEDYLKTYLERINKVTVADIKKAFQHIVNPDKELLVMVGQS